jgi:PAS domain S-box-containing protein
MRFFPNMSIRRKQMLVIMLTSTVALLLACAIFVTHDVVTARKEMVNNVSVLAEAVGNNCSATIEFDDPKTAEDTLAALRAEPGIVYACIYSSKGKSFAVYSRTGSAAFKPPPLQAEGHEFNGDFLYLFRPIVQRNQTVGTIFVASDLSELHERLARYPVIVGEMLAAALLVAFILSARLHRVITDPILHLAQVARTVATDKNYSIRAQKESDNELGRLIGVFNEMLGQIQQRDAELQSARDLLEHRVKERTEELRQSQALYHSLVGHLPVHIYRKDHEGRFVFVNEHFCRFNGLTERQVLGKTVFDILPNKGLCERHSEEERMVMNSGESIEREEHYASPDGKMKYLQTIKSPVFGAEDKAIGTQSISLDITERKEAEANLERVHRELVTASRQAGMAEVATSVLHNVGNVLNSVNVAASTIADKIKQSKTASVTRLAVLLRRHASDLGNFLTVDPNGKKIPTYIEDLAGFLAEEQAFLLEETDLVKKHIDHIKDIVSMQQNYAKVAGVTEIVKVPDLVEDAVRMNVGALVRHEVKLIREFDPNVPPIIVDKHKVLQILVNLIRNAKYACEDAGRKEKQLVIRIRNTENVVRIMVVDNGVGIPTENLTRIFNHGFTTRKNGHGFGLHSGALAAKEMGGALFADSEGLGKGATFTLELPLQSAKKDHES